MRQCVPRLQALHLPLCVCVCMRWRTFGMSMWHFSGATWTPARRSWMNVHLGVMIWRHIGLVWGDGPSHVVMVLFRMWEGWLFNRSVDGASVRWKPYIATVSWPERIFNYIGLGRDWIPWPWASMMSTLINLVVVKPFTHCKKVFHDFYIEAWVGGLKFQYWSI